MIIYIYLIVRIHIYIYMTICIYMIICVYIYIFICVHMYLHYVHECPDVIPPTLAAVKIAATACIDVRVKRSKKSRGSRAATWELDQTPMIPRVLLTAWYQTTCCPLVEKPRDILAVCGQSAATDMKYANSTFLPF